MFLIADQTSLSHDIERELLQNGISLKGLQEKMGGMLDFGRIRLVLAHLGRQMDCCAKCQAVTEIKQ